MSETLPEDRSDEPITVESMRGDLGDLGASRPATSRNSANPRNSNGRTTPTG